NLSGIHNTYDSGSGSASQNGYGLGVSVEVGRPWRLGDSHWKIEPQAQLSYQYVHLNDFDDDVSTIDDQSGGTLRGLLGARLAYNNDNGEQRTHTFYVTANVLHDFTGNKSEASLGRDDLRETYRRTWGELGVGAQFPLGKSAYLYGDVRYARAFSGGTDVYRGSDTARESIRGRVGVRFMW
ncbi:MAG: autotransporter domain-containing protein, partial [Castellaniella sp.]|uniref:autotransporter domain-containing protein n=1 Tax=Castellaniella sp. TaxID=1955812 RepID=UPI003A8BF10C